MCQETNANGVVTLPGQREINTGMSECQRTGIFINGSDADVVVYSMLGYIVPAGKCLTIPIGPQVLLLGEGRGLVIWTTTTAVLAPELIDAPAVQLTPTAPKPGKTETLGPDTFSTPINAVGGSVDITLSGGDYHKLVFLEVK